MSLRRFPAAVALAAWSVFVWTTRIRNVWSDDQLSTGEQWTGTALALSFIALALAVGWSLVRSTSWRRRAVLALASWTIAVWVVRSIGIATADHDGAFIAVHLVLAVISIGLAGFAIREASRQVTRLSA